MKPYLLVMRVFSKNVCVGSQSLKEQGGAIIFVSHDMNAIKQLCDHAILLNHGDDRC